MSFVANPSHQIAQQIEQAESIEALAEAAQRMDRTVVKLHEAGVRIEQIARLAGEMNQRLFARAWQFVAPPAIVENTCLIVMGSEGRGEQILRTDQDNALILRDGFAHAALDACATRFSEALAAFGYPPCPGNIMVTNPIWRQSVSQFKAMIHQWFVGGDPEGSMQLAIFYDAAPVTGDERLFAELKSWLDDCAATHQAHIHLFASAADRFSEGRSWFRWLAGKHGDDPVELKKLGIFPIVHGVRALSLRHGVREQSTAQRLQALRAKNAIREQMAHELTGALHFLMALRLRQQLVARRAGERPTNAVRPSQLLPSERAPLKDVLTIVKDFRAYLRQEFRLDLL